MYFGALKVSSNTNTDTNTNTKVVKAEIDTSRVSGLIPLVRVSFEGFLMKNIKLMKFLRNVKN